ncbi:MAG TPA: hypothetical protein VGO65_12335, partial [Pseudolysinimonas sp.]|nr:hypothetical protein [Pseudolysinimonas sp.]
YVAAPGASAGAGMPAPLETPVAVAPATPAAAPSARAVPKPVAERTVAPEVPAAREVPAASAAPAAPAAKQSPRRASVPSHLAAPIPEPSTDLAIVERPAARGGHRRVTAPAGKTALATPTATPAEAEKPAPPAAAPITAAPATAAPAPAERAAAAPATASPRTAAPRAATPPAAKAPAPQPVVEEKPAPASAPLPEPRTERVTEVEHIVGTARELDYAFAALPTATAAEQRAGSLMPEIESSKPTQVERPIVIKPDPPRPSSRFAPDPARFTQRLAGAYASAPAPTAGTQGAVPEVKGTVVNTVSIRVQRDVIESATVPPPIRHILPRPGSTVPPKAVEAARRPAPEPEPELVELRPRTGPVPVPPLAREPLPEPSVAAIDDDPTAETRAIPIAGSLLGEIGGLPRVEVRAARPAAVNETAPNPEREARESYEQRARQLERVAHERLMREQQRLAVDIREQLAHDKRELESVLDNRLEDTVRRPVALSRRRAEDPRFSDPSDDTGDTR